MQGWSVLAGAQQPLPGCQHPDMAAPAEALPLHMPTNEYGTVHCALCLFWSFILPSVHRQDIDCKSPNPTALTRVIPVPPPQPTAPASLQDTTSESDVTREPFTQWCVKGKLRTEKRSCRNEVHKGRQLLHYLYNTGSKDPLIDKNNN